MTNKRFLSGVVALCAVVTLTAAPTVRKPAVKSATSFAIFIDSDTYKALAPKVEAYKDAVEADGLATYIVSDKWDSPEQVKDQISRLYHGKTPIEGVVFIGNIPIAMLRDAQHMTSAFKMKQEADWKDSSVPSDRFYDDFDLKFDFIRRDTDKPDYFYYSLRPDSEQHVSSDIYSARVRAEGDDAIDKIGKFLDQAVAAHAGRNALDNAFMFRGHGYNSDALDAWAGEQANLREQLPSLFYGEGRVRFYEHSQKFPIKDWILEQLRDPSMDMALMHHHGSEDTEYINGSNMVSDNMGMLDNVRRNFRSRIRRSKDAEATRKSIIDTYGVPEGWLEINDSLAKADDAYGLSQDLYTSDVRAAAPACRFVVFDACYNGSFHTPDYIAGAYIFSGGGTVITQGNTVNSLQDRLPDRYMGLLAYGVRVGNWAKYQQTTIETHLVGDPTFRFENSAAPGMDLNAMLVAGGSSPKTWLKILKKGDSSAADLQAIALRKLADGGYEGMSGLLQERFHNSRYGVVRNEALQLMSTRRDSSFAGMLKTGMRDNCELVRRMSAAMAGRYASPELAPYVVRTLIEEKLSKRTAYRAMDSFVLMDRDAVMEAVDAEFAARPYLMEGTGLGKDELVERYGRYYDSIHEDMELVMDRNAKLSRRKNELKTYRNYNYDYMLGDLIAFAEDASQDWSLRVTAVEALGWFDLSYRVGEIEEACGRILDSDAPEPVRNEALKTINRLKAH